MNGMDRRLKALEKKTYDIREEMQRPPTHQLKAEHR